MAVLQFYSNFTNLAIASPVPTFRRPLNINQCFVHIMPDVQKVSKISKFNSWDQLSTLVCTTYFNNKVKLILLEVLLKLEQNFATAPAASKFDTRFEYTYFNTKK